MGGVHGQQISQPFRRGGSRDGKIRGRGLNLPPWVDAAAAEHVAGPAPRRCWIP